jgi:hypothetical protein
MKLGDLSVAKGLPRWNRRRGHCGHDGTIACAIGSLELVWLLAQKSPVRPSNARFVSVFKVHEGPSFAL